MLVYSMLYLITGGIIASTMFLLPHPASDFPILRFIIICLASVLLTKYFVYMFVSPWHDVLVSWRNLRYRNELADFYPTVSVMIPAWNEERGLLDTIRTLLKSTYRNVEIIVVNDGSTDGSDSLMRKFLEKYDAQKKTNKINIVYHYKENGGKGAALNTAIELATGDILVSIDADCVVMPETISNFVKPFVDPSVMAAVGNVKVGNTDHLVGVVQYLEFLFSFYFKKADSVMNTIYIIGGAAGAFRKEVFEVVGRYNTKNITEDIELSVRIQRAGMRTVYADDAIVYTEGASRITDLMKQRLRWKRGRFETFFDHRDLFFSLDKEHNQLLTCLILPLAYFGEMQLMLEPFFVAFLYIYSALINDFSSFISGIIVVASMFFVQIFFDDKESRKLSFYLLTPIGWLLLYVATFVEWQALFNSLWGMIRKKDLKWQRWQRQGVGV
jgi:cellulose synthase/poly-beta-1,6-N-acetylglucosamine synthase-like glycosyltransferase